MNTDGRTSAAPSARQTNTPHLPVKRVMVPIDFSKTSVAALRYAIPLTQQFGATLELVHAIEPTPFLSDMDNLPLAMSDAEVAQRVTAELAALARREVPPGVPVEPVVRRGKPYQEITEAAKARNVDLIVIATHGRTGLQHTLLGSTAERVVRLAPCPVLVVRGVGSGA